jgi:choline dehydrogenase
MVWLRGHPRDFDGWAQLGARGWSYEDVLPYFCRSETAPTDTDTLRGKGGPIRITRGDVEASPLAKAFVEAGVEAGYPRTRDFNGGQQEGFGAVERSTWRGRRWSAAHAYLNPVRSRPNLTVITGAHALGVELEGQRATGLRYAKDGRDHVAKVSREVILSSGSIGSPHILQLSGIGSREHLEAAGIKVRHALSGVGENLNDHPDLVIQHVCKQPVSLYPVTRAPRSWLAGVEWMLKGTGPAATNHFEAGGFITSRPELEHPDIQYTFMPLAVVPGGVDVRMEHAFQVHIDLMRPRSRGHVRALSSNPMQAPEILFNYLDDPQDLADLRAGVRLLRDILSRPALAPFAGAELFPGPAVQTDEAIDRWIRETLETCYHPVGTCRMGAADDPGAVVDPECRVRGLQGLRVVDASIMPAIVSSNTNASTIMMAEKAADIIRGRTPLRATIEDTAQSLNTRISA